MIMLSSIVFFLLKTLNFITINLKINLKRGEKIEIR